MHHLQEEESTLVLLLEHRIVEFAHFGRYCCKLEWTWEHLICIPADGGADFMQGMPLEE